MIKLPLSDLTMSEAVMFDKVKAAMLKCSTKSEQLEEAAGQLTVQKLR